MNNLASIVKESECEEELSRDVFHERHCNTGLEEEASELGHVWAHGFEDEADMVAVGANMLKAVQNAENVQRPWLCDTFRFNLFQDAHLERVLFMPIRVGREQLQCDVPFCATSAV